MSVPALAKNPVVAPVTPAKQPVTAPAQKKHIVSVAHGAAKVGVGVVSVPAGFGMALGGIATKAFGNVVHFLGDVFDSKALRTEGKLIDRDGDRFIAAGDKTLNKVGPRISGGVREMDRAAFGPGNIVW